MKVAITGSSGLIGTALIRALEERGDEVVRVVRSNARPSDCAWDIYAGTIDADALVGIDGVVHLAGEGIGEKKWSDEQKAKVTESRTLGTALIAETIAGLEQPPSVFVSGSAIGFYGNRGDAKLTERDARGSGFLSDVVTAWESAAQPAIDAGIRTAFIRTGVVLSTEGGALKEQLPFFKLGIGGNAARTRQRHLGSGQSHGAESVHERRLHEVARQGSRPTDLPANPQASSAAPIGETGSRRDVVLQHPRDPRSATRLGLYVHTSNHR